MKREYFSDTERNNRVAMTTHFAMIIVMSIFCLLQTLGGLQGFGYLFVILVLGFVPVGFEFYFWKKDTNTPMIKPLFAIGFAVYYSFAIFTSNDNLVFLFVIPMIIVASIFNDAKYSALINIGTITESFLLVIIGSQTGKFGYAGMNAAILQVTVMILVGIYSSISARTIHQNLTRKLDHIRELSEKTEAAIGEISSELQQLDESSKATMSAMSDVNAGTADTACAVQNQLSQTESIQQQIEDVNSSASAMSDSIQDTLHSVEAGHREVERLVSQVDESVATSALAIEKLNALKNHMKEMESITKLIDDIAFQTNIMALNANVEAARAGEAGRGFSVVASQVSEMSLKTKNATEDIAELIRNVSASLSDVVSVISRMVDGIHEEKQCTSSTSENFSSIQSNAFAIRDNVNDLMNHITYLTDANRGISDSIQTISAASEEVSALANEAMNSEGRNVEILDSVSTKMQKLLTDTISSDFAV